MNSVWDIPQKPLLLLAPMEGVTDLVFRQIIATCARPDIFVTEFTSIDGYFSPGRSNVAQNLRFQADELPLIAQVWGRDVDRMERMAHEIARLGFSGIDINMGCPDRTVMAHGCGAALIDEPDVAKSLIEAAKRGSEGLPVSVKTRLGRRTNVAQTWIPFLLALDLDAITIHARTAKELSKVAAHREEFGLAVDRRNEMNVRTKIIGNGDIKNAREAGEIASQYGLDGVMIGRGIFENLWAFDRTRTHHTPTRAELFGLMKKHILLFVKTWGDTKNYATLKKYFKVYVNGFDHATEVRDALMKSTSYHEALQIIDAIT